MAEQRFEDAMKRLEEIVEALEGGELPLEESLKRFEEGMALVKFCNRRLDEAERRVTLLLEDQDGKTREIPFAPEDEKDGGQI